MRNTAWMLFGALALGTAASVAADLGSTPAPTGQASWARWQGRLSLGTSSTPWRSGADNAAQKLSSASLMGDYYFISRPLLADPRQLGGFRATSGLIFGPRSMLSTGQPGLATGGALSIGSRTIGAAAPPYLADAANEVATTPYLGLGYTSLSLRSGWSFSADLGLVAQGSGGVRLGRSHAGNQGLDDAVRDIRMTPLLQFGVSYSF
jgi:hypothetical protein